MGKRPRSRSWQIWYDTVKKTLKEIKPVLDMKVALDRKGGRVCASGDGSKWTAIIHRRRRRNIIQLMCRYWPLGTYWLLPTIDIISHNIILFVTM